MAIEGLFGSAYPVDRFDRPAGVAYTLSDAQGQTTKPVGW